MAVPRLVGCFGRVMLSAGALLICTAASLTLSATAAAQTTIAEVDSRLARVERVLDQSLLEQLQRVDSLQRELRQLRGEIEKLNNDMAILTRRNRSLYEDADTRLTQLEESAQSGSLFGEDGVVFEGLDEDALEGGVLDETTGAFNDPDGNGRSQGSGVGSGATGGSSAGVFVSERSRPSNTPVQVRSNATQAEKAAYTQAYDLLARGQHTEAVVQFDAFLEEYPAGPYSFNAWYWKGEAMYAERRFDEAIANFQQVSERFPTSTKVPDAQLKIGFSLYEQGRYAEARPVLEQVRDQFPGRSAAVLARKRLQQMDREGV